MPETGKVAVMLDGGFFPINAFCLHFGFAAKMAAANFRSSFPQNVTTGFGNLTSHMHNHVAMHKDFRPISRPKMTVFCAI